MKRHVPGLSQTARDSHSVVPDGLFLVRVDGAQNCWRAQKRFYVLRLSVLEPKSFAGRSIVSRLYCTPKAMWKLGWFLRDFLYDPELLSRMRSTSEPCEASSESSRLATLWSTAFRWSISTASPRPASGKNWPPPSPFRRQVTARARGSRGPHDDLQLHPDLPVPDLPSPLSPSLSRWLAGERCPSRHAFRPLLRTGGCGFIPS